MKYPTEKSKKYPGLEQLSTAELEDLLRRDFATSGGRQCQHGIDYRNYGGDPRQRSPAGTSC